jgi:HNH endonuclease
VPEIEYGDTRLPERYWIKVYPCPVTGCWLWGNAHKAKGYGIITFGGRMWSAHRLMFSLVTGFDSETVCHTCDMPPCVRPDHLFAGTNALNNQDMIRKDRHGRGERARLARLTDGLVREIIALKNTNVTEASVGAKYGITQSHVGTLWRGETWQHLQIDPVLAEVVAKPVRRARPTHCRAGHLFTPENTRYRPNGTRNCKRCHADSRASGKRTA